MDTGHLLEENSRLRRAVEELTTLNDLARSISVLGEPAEIMRTIVRRAVKAVHATQGSITLVRENLHDPLQTLVRTTVSSAQAASYHFDQELLGWMYLHKRPLLVNDATSDSRFRRQSKAGAFRKLLAVPMMVKSQLIGILTVFDRSEEADFTDDDARLLGIMAGQSAQVVENARLEEEERQLERMRREVTAAATIQGRLLPTSMPQVPGYEIFAVTHPAASVGGDYYDVLAPEHSRITWCLGDVSGKGLPAALLMANLQATFRATVGIDLAPREILSHSNRLLFRSTDDDKFATMFLAVLNAERHTLQYGNAGHESGIHCTASGQIRELAATGLPLGMFDALSYQDDQIELQPSDVVVVYSDGLSEHFDAAGSMFGRERIADLVKAHRELPARVLGTTLVDAVSTFGAGVPQSDDQTLVILRRLAPA